MLEHEQIHFAIPELGARRMNANTPQIVREIESKNLAASDTGAIERAQTELNRVLLQRGALDKARNDAFDKETWFGYNPERQKLGLAQINAELVATAGWASAPRAHYQRWLGAVRAPYSATSFFIAMTAG